MSGVHDVVVIGVGQARGSRDKEPDSAREPLDLIREACESAARDLDPGLDLSEVDAVGVVQVMSWAYADTAAAVSRAIGAEPAYTEVSGVGGHQPVAVLSRLADRVASGESSIALLCGGEAQASVDLLGAQKDPDAAPAEWSREPGGAVPFSRETGGSEAMWDVGLVAPIRVYPLWENALRTRLHQSFAQSQDWSADLYARFSQVASRNDAAWGSEPYDASAIKSVDRRNRMICWPYPLRMNALNRVDQAAAVLIATGEVADRLGVPVEDRIYLRAASTTADCDDVLEREAYDRAPGMERSLDLALRAAGIESQDLGVIDLYSCFPVVPKLGILHLGLDAASTPSVTGGLSSFGGPHNNYSTHALVAVVRALRKSGGDGLVYAQGEYLTRHATVVLTTRRPAGGFTSTDEAQPPHGPVAVDAKWTGPLRIETYTVEFDHEGVPARAYVIGRTSDGQRTAVRASRSDQHTLRALTDPERDPVGAVGQVVADGDRRIFRFTG